MDTLKVCISLIITCLNQRFESCLHKCTYTAAEHCLLTEKVCLRLCPEGCLKNACSCTANGKRISKSLFKSLACSILLNSHKTRNTLSCLILRTYRMTGSLGSYHCNVNILRRNDTSEMDIEAMSEHEHVSGLKVGLNILLIHISLFLIVYKDHDDISLPGRFSCRIYFKALLNCLVP